MIFSCIFDVSKQLFSIYAIFELIFCWTFHQQFHVPIEPFCALCSNLYFYARKSLTKPRNLFPNISYYQRTRLLTSYWRRNFHMSSHVRLSMIIFIIFCVRLAFANGLYFFLYHFVFVSFLHENNDTDSSTKDLLNMQKQSLKK